MSLPKTLDFFKSRCVLDPDSHCWLWREGLTPTGNPLVWYDGRHVLARRLAYFLVNGEWPEKPLFPMFCRSKLCCSPHHMRQVDRARIPGLMKAFGMGASGTRLSIVRRARPSRAKLSWPRVREIRARIRAADDAGIEVRPFMTALAAEVGVHERQLYKIKANECWREAGWAV